MTERTRSTGSPEMASAIVVFTASAVPSAGNRVTTLYERALPHETVDQDAHTTMAATLEDLSPGAPSRSICRLCDRLQDLALAKAPTRPNLVNRSFNQGRQAEVLGEATNPASRGI